MDRKNDTGNLEIPWGGGGPDPVPPLDPPMMYLNNIFGFVSVAQSVATTADVHVLSWSRVQIPHVAKIFLVDLLYLSKHVL